MTQEEIKLQPHKMVDGIAVLLTEEEINELSNSDPNDINNKFEEKHRLLKQSRSKLLSSSKLPITLNGVSTEFDLHSSDLPILQGRVDRLANNTDTLGWNDNQGNRVQLNKEAFRSLIRHIQVNDISTWDIYSEKLEELKNLKNSGDLEGIKNFNTNL